METDIVRIKKIKLKNFKNVRHGVIDLESEDGILGTTNVMGIYGQNGSGKSAVIDAFKVIQKLLVGARLGDEIEDYIMCGSDNMEIEVEFRAKTSDEYFDALYFVEIGKNIKPSNNEENSINISNENNESKIIVYKEKIEFRHNETEEYQTFIDYDINEKEFKPIDMYKELINNDDLAIEGKLSVMISICIKTNGCVVNSYN